MPAQAEPQWRPWHRDGRKPCTLAINVVTIAGIGALTYGLLGMRREEAHRFVKSRFWRGEE